MRIRVIDICPLCKDGEEGNPYVTCGECRGKGEVKTTIDLEELVELVTERVLAKVIEATMTNNG